MHPFLFRAAVRLRERRYRLPSGFRLGLLSSCFRLLLPPARASRIN
ncbi:hypothetical protein [Methanimicrococcus hacksteinii]|nr:hypothetical protein [Methanimicrococcus sp. At1]